MFINYSNKGYCRYCDSKAITCNSTICNKHNKLQDSLRQRVKTIKFNSIGLNARGNRKVR